MSNTTIGIAVVSTLLIAGCAQASQGAPTPVSSGGAGVIPAGLEHFYNQQLSWESCDKYTAQEDVRKAYTSNGQDCAKVTVPVDYEHPDGATAQIAINRKHATGAKIGSLLVNPGGPGASGLQMAANIAPKIGATQLGERFDLIGFDPRGIGASTPQVRCQTDAEIDTERHDPVVPNTPDGITVSEQKAKDFAAECSAKLGAGFLAHAGTREVVRDMDVIRSVLGDEKLTYLGWSYGTRIGSTYAETFPANVRALVLDGALDPKQDPVQQAVKQSEGFQKAFDDFAADCAKSPRCPLGAAPELAVQKFHELVDPLMTAPADTASDPRGLSYSDAITATIQALYSPSMWNLLKIGLIQLAHGLGDALLYLADAYYERNDDGTYNNNLDVQAVVGCVDNPPMTDRAVAAEKDRRAREVAPAFSDGPGTGAAPLDACAFWPVPNTSAPHTIDAPGLPKVVVVSTTHDPATPYQAGIDLAKELNASLITYQGTRHGAALIAGAACVDDPVIDYLVNLNNPHDGLSCATAA